MRYLTSVFVLVLILASATPAHAISNTHSMDFERGSTQFLSIADASQTGLDITGDMTVEAWMKIESQPNNDGFSIASKWSAPSDFSYIAMYRDDGGTKKFRFYNSSAGNNSTFSHASVNYTLNTGVWYHVAFVYTASTGSVEVFVNGNSVGSANGLSTSLYSGSGPFQIGSDDGGDYADSLIDEVRVWNDARSQSEIEDNMFVTLTGSEANLKGYWQLDNDFADTTANNNDLSNNGSAVFSEEPAHQIDCSFGSVTGDLFAGITGSAMGSFNCTFELF